MKQSHRRFSTACRVGAAATMLAALAVTVSATPAAAANGCAREDWIGTYYMNTRYINGGFSYTSNLLLKADGTAKEVFTPEDRIGNWSLRPVGSACGIRVVSRTPTRESEIVFVPTKFEGAGLVDEASGDGTVYEVNYPTRYIRVTLTFGTHP